MMPSFQLRCTQPHTLGPTISQSIPIKGERTGHVNESGEILQDDDHHGVLNVTVVLSREANRTDDSLSLPFPPTP